MERREGESAGSDCGLVRNNQGDEGDLEHQIARWVDEGGPDIGPAEFERPAGQIGGFNSAEAFRDWLRQMEKQTWMGD